MLVGPEIAKVVRATVSQTVPDDLWRHISVEQRLDSEGQPAIFVVVEVTDDALDAALTNRSRVGVALQEALAASGEDRFAFVSFTSPADIEEAAREDAA